MHHIEKGKRDTSPFKQIRQMDVEVDSTMHCRIKSWQSCKANVSTIFISMTEHSNQKKITIIQFLSSVPAGMREPFIIYTKCSIGKKLNFSEFGNVFLILIFPTHSLNFDEKVHVRSLTAHSYSCLQLFKREYFAHT